MAQYLRLTDSENLGKIVKINMEQGKPPKAFMYDKTKDTWEPMVGFFFDYTIPEEDNKFELFEEISEEEVKKYTTDFVGKAHEIATKYHEGQKDKAGKDYIRHPEFVASLVATDEEKAVAYLHDTLEDTALTVDDLQEAKIPNAVIEAVNVITKKNEDDYFRYLERVKENPIARQVKLADLAHNSDLTRLEKINPEDMKRLVKYKEAQQFLKE